MCQFLPDSYTILTRPEMEGRRDGGMVGWWDGEMERWSVLLSCPEIGLQKK